MSSCRAPPRWFALVCLVLAAAPAAASSGVSINAFAGAGYLLDTIERRDSFAARSLFDFTAGLSVNGGFVRPQLLQWNASVTYLGNRQALQQGAVSAMDAVTFGGRLALLSGTPTPITLFATRISIDVSEITPRRSTGSSVTTGFGGAVAVSFLDFPKVSASLGRTIVETTSIAGRRDLSGLTTLRLGLAQQFKWLEYSGSYVTNWSNGTFSDLQYGSHDIAVRAAAPLSPTLQFVANDQYFVRLPTSEAPSNPRYETNSLSTLLIWRRSKSMTANLGYASQQSNIFAPATLDLANSSHSLAQSLQWNLRDNLVLTEQLDALTATSRTGPLKYDGAQGGLGAAVTWLHPTWWGGTSLGGGGSVGLAGDSATPVTATGGAHLTAQFSVAHAATTGSGLYSIVYSDTGTAVFGRTFRQNLRLELITVPRPGVRLRAFIAGYGAKRDNAVIGTALQRNLQAALEASYLQHQLLIFGGYSDGLPESLGNPIFADGLFLPAPYNSQFASIGATVSTVPVRDLLLRATGRFAHSAGLGRYDEQEIGLTFTAQYTIGKFRLSAEDRLVLGYPDTRWYRNNTLMLRITRDFDWSF